MYVRTLHVVHFISFTFSSRRKESVLIWEFRKAWPLHTPCHGWPTMHPIDHLPLQLMLLSEAAKQVDPWRSVPSFLPLDDLAHESIVKFFFSSAGAGG